jgi:hypothetical protein
MTAELISRPYEPNPEHCCEACVFGRGDHAEWCETGRDEVRRPEETELHHAWRVTIHQMLANA